MRDPSDPYQNPFYYSGYKVFHGSSTGFEDVTSHWSAWLVNWLGCYGSAPTAVDFNEVRVAEADRRSSRGRPLISMLSLVGRVDRHVLPHEQGAQEIGHCSTDDRHEEFGRLLQVYLGVRPTSTTRGFQYLNPSTSGLEWSNNEDGTASDVNGGKNYKMSARKHRCCMNFESSATTLDGHADVLIVGSSGFWKLFLGHGDATFTEVERSCLPLGS
eukprot:SAG31_NODE_105_length_25008_cov_17.439399_13_plen_215_part_00